jgi:hypothetical protein
VQDAGPQYDEPTGRKQNCDRSHMDSDWSEQSTFSKPEMRTTDSAPLTMIPRMMYWIAGVSERRIGYELDLRLAVA